LLPGKGKVSAPAVVPSTTRGGAGGEFHNFIMQNIPLPSLRH
jgi:hypothetical protein